MNTKPLLFRFRAVMLFFIFGLVVSGVTAFPLLDELNLLCNMLGVGSAPGPEGHAGLEFWLLTVRQGLANTYAAYPWMAYGTDWLAFAHLMIAVFFVGPLIHPLSGRSTIYAGIFACGAVIPLAMICGTLRGIPFYWRLIDCSFGIFGVMPLLYCLRLITRIEVAQAEGVRPAP